MRDLRGKVAVVTGAASGIGRALAYVLAERGCDLALVDVQQSGLEETERGVRAKGRKVSLHRTDVSDRPSMQALPEAVLREHGHVDVVINNAGVATGYTFEEQTLESFDRVLGINFMGVVHGCKFFLPLLRQRPEAQIVNVSSVFGLLGIPRQAAYCSSKFAVRGLSESLWAELRQTSVSVLCVHPGGVRTNIVRAGSGWAAGAEETARLFEGIARTSPERAAERIVRAIEKGRLRLRIGLDARIADWVVRLFPTVSRLLRSDTLDAQGAPPQGDPGSRAPLSPVSTSPESPGP